MHVFSSVDVLFECFIYFYINRFCLECHFFLVGLTYLLIIKAGAPIEQFPKDDWNYVHHEIMDGGDNIYIWAKLYRKR